MNYGTLEYAYVPNLTVVIPLSLFHIIIVQYQEVQTVFNGLNFLCACYCILKGGRIHVFEIWVHMSQPYNMTQRTQYNICVVADFRKAHFDFVQYSSTPEAQFITFNVFRTHSQSVF